MAITIKTAGLESYLEGDVRHRFLIFGAPGTGKTPFAAQAPDPIFLMADRNGPDSLVLTQTPFIPIRGEKDMLEALALLENEALRKAPRWKTVVFDTISVYQQHVLQEMLRKLGKDSPDDFREWGELTAKVTKVLHRLQNLDMSVIVLCHTKDKFNSEDGELEPNLVGGLKETLPREFSNIGWARSKWAIQKGADGTEQRVLARSIRWKPTPKVQYLRSAAAMLPAETPINFEPADYQQLIDAFEVRAKEIGASSAEVVEETEVKTETEIAVESVEPKSGPVAAVKATELPKARAKKSDAPAAASALSEDDAARRERVKAKQAARATETPASPTTPATAEPVAEPIETPADEHAEAVAVVEDVLEAEVVESFDLIAAIDAATNADQLKTLWSENKDDWTPEHTARVKARKAALGI